MLEGIPSSPGIAIARVRIITPGHEGDLDDRQLAADEVAMEVERLREAIRSADRTLEQIEMMAREEIHDRAGIFEALRMMLLDPVLSNAIIDHITSRSATAHAAVVAEMTRLADLMMTSPDETLRSRAEDIHALQSHLLAALSNTVLPNGIHRDAVLVFTALSPVDAVVHARHRAAAFVLEAGGINSHAAILSRAFSIPMVAGVRGVTSRVETDELVIVDGYSGHLILSPTEETIARYRVRKEELERQRKRYQEVSGLPAETSDGVRITLAANLDMLHEIEETIENGADEIGLMRTEYLVMGRDAGVGMEEQLHHYRQIAERAYPLTVTLRAFDIGTEKLAGETWGRSQSPLGLRGSRLLLAREDIFRTQIEAVLRASTMKNIALMLPMVTSVDELRHAKRVLEDVRRKLRAEGVRFDELMPLGAMIETPAAALTADWLARESAFLSIGTNDLTQYTLAVDRDEDTVASHYDELHPAVLRLIRASILSARRAGVPITLCGEIAINPLATGVLLGIGLRRFSVPPLELGALRMRVRAISIEEACAQARAVMKMPSAAEVRAFLSKC
jgi:phosphotransferase system enzyme I (PtsI)